MGTVRKVCPLLGESASIEELRDFIVGVSLRNDPVLVTGDAGTGKGLTAHKIHAVGAMARAPFLKVCCHRFDGDELESLLFGRTSQGHLSGILGSSSGSTCHIAGLEFMAPGIAGKLSRYLTESSLEKGRPRLVFTSRHTLADLHGGGFDPRFLELISTYHTRIPPLRDRVEDIPILASYQVWLQSEADEYETCWRAFQQDLLGDMLSYPWPGNVRELNQFVQSFCGVHREGSRFRSEVCAEVTPSTYLRAELEEQFERFLGQLELEELTGRDLVLPQDARFWGEFDVEN